MEEGGEAKTYSQEEFESALAEKIAEANKGLEQNRNAALAEAKKAKEALKQFDGIDPEEYRSLKEAREAAEREKQEAAGNWKALEEQLLKKHSDSEARWKNEEKRLRQALDDYLIDAEATRELAAYTESPDLLLPHVKRHMRVIEQDGRFASRIVDANGNVRIGKGEGSAPMTLSELLDEMKQDKRYALAFKGTGSSGGGASRSAAGGGGQKIAADDNASFIGNLDAIASGKMKVSI